MPRDQFIHQWELAAVASCEDHHSGQTAPIVCNHFSELPDAISSRGDVVERQESFAGFDGANSDVGPDPSGVATIRCQRQAQWHHVVELILNSLREYLCRGG